MLEFIKHIDTRILLYINGHHSLFWDNVMWQISERNIWIPFYIILLGVIIYKFKKQTWIILLGVIVLIVLSDQISSGIIKPLVERLRPSNDPLLRNQIHIVNKYTGGLYGFISSHAANTFAIATFLALLFKQKIFTLCILIWAAIVSFSRIYLGVHYPGDVLCGAMLGIGVGFLVIFFVNKILEKRMHKKDDAKIVY